MRSEQGSCKERLFSSPNISLCALLESNELMLDGDNMFEVTSYSGSGFEMVAAPEVPVA
jgi:hypothetical protein